MPTILASPLPRRPIAMSPLSPVASISLSGMRAAQAALDASGHNLANLATPGFRRQLVLQSSDITGGASTTFVQADQPRHAIETDMVDQLVARNAFLANLAVFKTGDQMLGTLLDARR
jgi:flagellar hook protein FlgE